MKICDKMMLIATATLLALWFGNHRAVGQSASVCAPAPSGLVSWWSGEGNANDSIGSNNGTLANGATFAPGLVGQAFSFDGVNDYVEFPDSPSLSITDTLSIDAWIKPNSVGAATILSKYDSSIHQESYVLAVTNGGTLRFYLAGTGGCRAVDTVNSVLSASVWTHVAATFNPAGQVMKIFVNGAEVPVTLDAVCNNTIASIFDSTTPVRLGALIGGSGQIGAFFSGLVDEVDLYNRVLTPDEIAAIYYVGAFGKCSPLTCAPSPQGLVSWWAGQGNANDSIGFNNGMLVNGATFAPGKVGQAFNLDGTNDYVQVPDSAQIRLGTSFSVELWFYQRSAKPGDGSRLLDKVTAGQSDGYLLDTYDGATGRKLRLCMGGSCGRGNTVYSLNAWHHAAVTYDGTTLTLFLDGQPDGSFAGIPAPPVNALPLFIGAPHVGCGGGCGLVEYFNGLLDEVSLYDRALVASEVQAIYNAGTVGKCPPPVPPEVTIQRSGPNVGLSWPMAAMTYALEYATNLVAPIYWNLSTDPAVAAGDRMLFILPIQRFNEFFRLHQFNSTLNFTLSMESPANPACGCGGAGYNQGIGQVSQECPDCGVGGAVPGIGQDAAGGSVFLHNGEFIQHVVDLEIPGRGFNWRMERKYRSGIEFDGPLGHNWEFNYNRRLVVETNGNVLRMDGYGRADRYVFTGSSYLAPAGYFTQLTRQTNGIFLERDRHGTKVFYAAPNPQKIARMIEMRDRNGNRIQFQYDASGRLTNTIDTLGRSIHYRYDPASSRLTQVEDFSGRVISYGYDGNGDLASVTSPAVTGTPNGNDFPNGKTVRYSYSSGFSDERLNHNLVSITAPNEVAVNGPPRTIVEYETNSASSDVDRIRRLTIGGVNAGGVPAGGTISYQYQSLGSVASNDFITAVLENTVIDRNSNKAEYQFNQLGNIVRVREFTRGMRANEPPFFETRYEYNADGKVTRVIYPQGNSVEYVYDSSNPDRFQQGNLLSETRRPDVARGGEQAFVQTTRTYEPIYNRLRTRTEARGNDPSYVPQNGGLISTARYSTVHTFDYQEGQDIAGLAAEVGVNPAIIQARLAAIPMNLGDINADGANQIHGNTIQLTRPTVTLLPSTNQPALEGGTAQPIVYFYTYNQYGQVTHRRDPEGNLTDYMYYPENDPDGDGRDLTPGLGTGPFGYLHKIVVDSAFNPGRDSRTDPTPVSMTTGYAYDRVGNLIRNIDGRGIATDFAVNQLNEVVQITRAAAHGLLTPEPQEPMSLTDFGFLQRTYYDFNGNVVHQQVEDRGNTSRTGGFVDSFHLFNILNDEIERSLEVSVLETLQASYRYDGNGNLTLVMQPEGNANSYCYDERDLPFQVARGALFPWPSTLGAPVGPYNRSEGKPSIKTFNYDPNRNVTEVVDAEDKDGSAANNSSIAGNGDATTFIYDGFDRPKSVVDAVGNQTTYNYDPAGDIIKRTRRGLVGGSSPINNSGLNNVDLVITEFSYDELRRLFQRDRWLFIPLGLTTMRPPNVTDGSLTQGDGKVTMRYEYDRNSRRTFLVEDNQHTARLLYDGANRLIKTVDPEWNIVEIGYDDNNNVIELRETDVCQVPGIPNEIFLTTFFYDSLNRLQRNVDNLGNTCEYRYDSRNNLVARSDANGPAGGAIARRIFTPGPLTVNTMNGPGNVTLYSYDGLSRMIQRDAVMTASGKGDGINIGADIFGVRNTIPIPDTSQAGGDGIITTRYQWDGNSLLTSLIDDNGNLTFYTYDNLNRRITENKGVCIAPALADRCDEVTTIINEYDGDDNRVRAIDENGSIVTNRYDAVNRLIFRQITRAPNVVGTTKTTYQYDGLSRRSRAVEDNNPLDPADDSTITFAYDSLSHVIEETQQIGSQSPKAISSSWNAERLRTSVTYPNGRVVAKTFDQLDRLQTVSDFTVAKPIAEYKYFGRRRIAQRRHPINGTRLTYLNDLGTFDAGYDGVRRPVQSRHIGSTNNLLVGFAYSYDRRNNKLMEKKLHAPAESELYEYDSAYRLISFDRGTLNSSNNAILVASTNAPSQSRWRLDGVGNWRTVNTESRLHGSFNQIIQRSNVISVVPLTNTTIVVISDPNGNVTDDGTFMYQYDYKNRLTTVKRKSGNDLVAEYTYDVQNRRIKKDLFSGGNTNGIFYFLDGAREIEERDDADRPKRQYVYGLGMNEPLVLDNNIDGDSVATGSGDQRLFYERNASSSIFALADTNGMVLEGYEYDAYGSQIVYEPGTNGVVDFRNDAVISPYASSRLGNPFLFSSRRLDAETSLYKYWDRYLNPEQGRFTTRSPRRSSNAAMNLYSYASSGPSRLSALSASVFGAAVRIALPDFSNVRNYAGLGRGSPNGTSPGGSDPGDPTPDESPNTGVGASGTGAVLKDRSQAVDPKRDDLPGSGIPISPTTGQPLVRQPSVSNPVDPTPDDIPDTAGGNNFGMSWWSPINVGPGYGDPLQDDLFGASGGQHGLDINGGYRTVHRGYSSWKQSGNLSSFGSSAIRMLGVPDASEDENDRGIGGSQAPGPRLRPLGSTLASEDDYSKWDPYDPKQNACWAPDTEPQTSIGQWDGQSSDFPGPDDVGEIIKEGVEWIKDLPWSGGSSIPDEPAEHPEQPETEIDPRIPL
jgi:RHS repeat-associated protein